MSQVVPVPRTKFEDVFHPSAPVSEPSRTINRLLQSRRTLRAFTVTRFAGVYTLHEAAQPSYDYSSRRWRFSGWNAIQDWADWDAVQDWADKADVRLVLPPPGNQADALIAVYRLVMGREWEQAVRLDGWPECNFDTWKQISLMFQEFDRARHPECLPGGMWMNNGFSSSGKDLPDWHFRRCGVITRHTPYRFRLKRLIFDNGDVSPRTMVHKEYLGFQNATESESFPSEDRAIAWCGHVTFSQESNDGEYITRTSDWITTEAAVTTAA